MIITEIYVPSLDRAYDFKLNEDIRTAVVIDEISNMICQKERCKFRGEKNSLLLFKADSNRVLSAELTLYENGVETGDNLILA